MSPAGPVGSFAPRTRATDNIPQGYMVDSANDIQRPWKRMRLKAPQDSPRWLERPPLDDFREALAFNEEIVYSSACSIAGIPLREFRRRCRNEVTDAARFYAEELGWQAELPADAVDRPWFVTGHQPVLAHPGVWSKNFVAHGMARQTAGVSLNLIVDNDLLASTKISVPARQDDRLVLQNIPFAEELSRTPWEEVEISSEDSSADMFAQFGARVCEAMQPWQIEPLMTRYWPAVIDRLPRTRRLSDLFSAGRHEIEMRWGVNNLELPISRMCQLPTCLQFIGHMLHHAREFAEIHNQVLAEYRRLYRIRSSTHPVPALEVGDGRCEAPFWIWKAGERQRRRLFVQQRDGELALSDGRETIATLPASENFHSSSAVMLEHLQELASRDYRLRTRALTTTLFARLGVADLFIHGIGGAQYDEMTDRIINRFFGIRAPRFLTVTSTLHLPLEAMLGTESRIGHDEPGKLAHQLRDLRYNPDRHLADIHDARDASVAALIAEKRELARQQREVDSLTGQTAAQRRQRRAANHRRYRRLHDINELLLPYIATQKHDVETVFQHLDRRLRNQRIRYNREYSVWLYPEEELHRFYARFLPGLNAEIP